MEISTSLTSLATLFAPILALVSENPVLLAVQGALMGTAFILAFFVFWVTKDILHRTNSVLFQMLCIAMTAVLPVVGFFLYLIIRPSQTIEERMLIDRMDEILSLMKEKEGKKDKIAEVKKEIRERSEKREKKDAGSGDSKIAGSPQKVSTPA